MALVVEDGTGKADAESYISVADATTYHAARGNASWAAQASDAVREQLLRKAADYMLQVYRLRWKGVRVTTAQALDWPRNGVQRVDYAYSSANGSQTIGGSYFYPSNAVPVEVARACAELALIAITETLAPAVGRLTKREKLGPMEVEYMDHQTGYTVYRAIDGLLAPFLTSQSGTFRSVVRV
jgi:hypothetical protein